MHSTAIQPNVVRPKQALVDISGLKAWYGDSQVLFDVTFSVHEGEVVGLTGRNGAGKTTTLRAIMGLLPCLSGHIALMGRNADGMRPSERAAMGVGYCPEERGIFASLTVLENLRLPPSISNGGMSEGEILSLFPNLKARMNNYGGQLSGGEQQMLAIGRILRTGARLLILDEPTEGLAPVIVKQIERALFELKRRGYTLLLVEQNLRFVMRLADRAIVLETGQIVDELITKDSNSRTRLAKRLAL